MLLFKGLDQNFEGGAVNYLIEESSNGEVYSVSHEDLSRYDGPVLGVFRDKNWNITQIHEVLPNELSMILKKEVLYFLKLDEYRAFADCCRRIIPSYFYEVPASTSGKHHPASNLGYGGLLRHTIFVCKNIQYLTTPESCKMIYNLLQADIDRMTIACMMHDFLKQGWDRKGYAFEHPNYAAKAIREMRGFLPDDDLEFIARCIETHMGEWNKAPGPNGEEVVITRKPETCYEHLVHMADYMASRPDVSLNLDNMYYAKEMYDATIVFSDMNESLCFRPTNRVD